MYVRTIQELYYNNYWLVKSAPAGQSHDHIFLLSTGIRYQRLIAQIPNRYSRQNLLPCWVPSFQHLHQSTLIKRHTSSGDHHPERGSTTATRWCCHDTPLPSNKCRKDLQAGNIQRFLQNGAVSLRPGDYWIQTPPILPIRYHDTKRKSKSECPQLHQLPPQWPLHHESTKHYGDYSEDNAILETATQSHLLLSVHCIKTASVASQNYRVRHTV
jgi:hypothetical protein